VEDFREVVVAGFGFTGEVDGGDVDFRVMSYEF
jgi:hypothetical protein